MFDINGFLSNILEALTSIKITNENLMLIIMGLAFTIMAMPSWILLFRRGPGPEPKKKRGRPPKQKEELVLKSAGKTQLKRKQPFKVDILTMFATGNKHEVVKAEALDFKHNEIDVKAHSLFKLKRNFFKRIYDKLKGIKGHYMIIFLDEKGKLPEYKGSERTPGILKTVHDNRALKKALREEFREAFNMRILFFIIVAIVAGVIGYLYYTGGLGL